MSRFVQRAAFWGIFDSSGAEVASYPFNDKSGAEAVLIELNKLVEMEKQFHKDVKLIPARSFHLRMVKKDVNDFMEVN